MIALILEIIIGFIISYFAYTWHWWIPTIIFPIIISIGNEQYSQPMVLSNYRRILDSIIMLTSTVYLISQIIIIHSNIGHWYGWVIGTVVGFIGMLFMFPKRWAAEKKMGN